MPDYYGDSLSNDNDAPWMVADKEPDIYDLESKYQVGFTSLDSEDAQAWEVYQKGYTVAFKNVTVNGLTLEEVKIIFLRRNASDRGFGWLEGGGKLKSPAVTA